MLLLTIGILSCSVTLTNAFNNDIEKNNKQDFTIYSHNRYIEDEYTDLNQIIKNKDFQKEVKEYTKYDIYNIRNLTTINMMTDQDKQKLKKKYGDLIELNTKVMVIKQSDYNNIMNIQNKPKINIKEDEYLETTNIDILMEYLTPFYKNQKKININNNYLKPATKHQKTHQVITTQE